MSDSMLSVSSQGPIRIITFANPPHNHIDTPLIMKMADALEAHDEDSTCRVNVLLASGKVYCAGADLVSGSSDIANDPAPFYEQVMRLYRIRKPTVTLVQGAAVGAGLGLAVAADFRVATPAARFCANFNRLGIHPGFGLSVTLPRLIGEQRAATLFFTGRRLNAEQALAIGLVDEVCTEEAGLDRAISLAQELAASSPRALQLTRETLRLGLADTIETVNRREREIQMTQFGTQEAAEGIAAMSERRLPNFPDF